MTSPIAMEPSAARLTNSLRDIGYDFETAVADIVDNSIAAGAHNVRIAIRFDGLGSSVVIADDGGGMSADELDEAMRFGSRRDYEDGELGRYGLGLKTASISQARTLTVVTNMSTERAYRRHRRLSLDHIHSTDRWEILDPWSTGNAPQADEVAPLRDLLTDGPGTVVAWTDLDRVLPENNPEGGWAERRFDRLARTTSRHLSMVFHRYLEGESVRRVDIEVNGIQLQPWNPFLQHPGTTALPERRLDLPGPGGAQVRWRPFVLPPRREWGLEAWEAAAGPMKWNKQQGLYVYRADRLIQTGGWAGMRGIDEHTKLARVAVDFPTTADDLFGVDVAKMRISVPGAVRGTMKKLVLDVCNRAEQRYRSGRVLEVVPGHAPMDATIDADQLRFAAMRTGVPGDMAAAERIIAALVPESEHVGIA